MFVVKKFSCVCSISARIQKVHAVLENKNNVIQISRGSKEATITVNGKTIRKSTKLRHLVSSL